MEGKITLHEAKVIMHLRDALGYAKPFSIEFNDFNRGKDEGGTIVNYDYVILTTNEDPVYNNSPKKNLKIERELEQGTISKNPNHHRNQTVNLVILAKDSNGRYVRTGHKHKCHIRLIQYINGQEIIW